MVEIEVYNTVPEHTEKYYERLKWSLEFLVSKTLAGKAEAGSTRGERGYQMVGATCARQVARALGANETKAEVLFMATGLYFPQYGQEGIRALKQYIADRNLDINPEELGILSVEYTVSWGKNVITTDFDQLIRQYFCGGEETLEVCIARFVQETIKEVKKTEQFYEGSPGDLLYEVTSEIVELAKENKKLVKSRILMQYEKQTADYQNPSLTDEQWKEVYDTLDRYIQEFGNHTETLKFLDKSPEEALLKYIYLYTIE